MSIINSQMPEFKVNAYRKDKGFFEVTNEDLKGKWSIFFFYPGDFTFVCPTELADLADHYEEFQALGVDIYSISTDSHFVHKAWADATDTIARVSGLPGIRAERNLLPTNCCRIPTTGCWAGVLP